jgi:hypothetical protein
MNKLFIYAAAVFSFISCQHERPLFHQIRWTHSGITFNNQIPENDTLNALDIANVYNGGGVGIGDFNNDGLQDIFFAGNIVPCRLYLNKGNFKFRDITKEANAGGEGKWCSGVSVVDINSDGWPDIYVCATLKKNPAERKNILYINQGAQPDNVPRFIDEAAEYGLDDSSYSVHAAFFDFDNDGDLDMYLGVNEVTESVFRYMNHPPLKNGENPSTGKLFRNDWNDSLKHPVFTDVSKESGIQTEGYANAIYILDINQDGWKDIYVSNDFQSSDLLWINNHNGTFTEQLSAYFKHISANATGCDMGDINNDGLTDMLVLDRSPEDNFRKKMMLQSDKDLWFRNGEGYNYQYARNTLQLNQGPRVLGDDSIGLPAFCEIGYLAGIESTDRSWGPLFADYDNDGNQDIIILNGLPGDITDHDFAEFRNKFSMVIPKGRMLTQIPTVKLHNYAYRNTGGLTFTDVSAAWGLGAPTSTNGAAYADLDQDGDLDLVLNNINDKARIYRNTASERHKGSSHYLQFMVKGEDPNRNGIGTHVEVYYDHGKKQVWDNNPFRGYLSSVEAIASFGLGKTLIADSVMAVWQNGQKQVIYKVPVDQTVILDIKKADSRYRFGHDPIANNTLFRDVTGDVNVQYTYREKDFNDFGIQPLLPHKLSDLGPSLASGDIDGNGLDDFICGGASDQSARLFLQQQDGRFIQRPLLDAAHLANKKWKDMGILLFDADNDGDLDLYTASGGYEFSSNAPEYQDHFYINNGKGDFREVTDAIPLNCGSKSAVRSVDYDRDGDLDLLVTGRVVPWKFPAPASCIILRNDTKNGVIKFTDVTSWVAKDLLNAGLVSDALFTDFNNDGWMDLILAGEWMPLTFLENEHGIFKNITDRSGVGNQVGWWNSIVAGDFDKDGDMDYIAGNLGENSYYRATDQHPVSIYGGDFSNSGRYGAFLSIYLPASQLDTTQREYPAQGRDDVIWQMGSLARKFPDYKSFALARMNELFTPDQLNRALIYRANNLKSCYCRNDGHGRFTLFPLPREAQFSVLNGMIVDDFDGDSNPDVLMVGNDYSTEVSVGRNDALNGLLLKGDGHGGFKAASILESGFYVPGNAKALVKLRGKKEGYLVAASQNKGPVKVFELKRTVQQIPWQPGDISAEITWHDGSRQKQECYTGSSYLSESAGFFTVSGQASSVTITNASGQIRTVRF